MLGRSVFQEGEREQGWQWFVSSILWEFLWQRDSREEWFSKLHNWWPCLCFSASLARAGAALFDDPMSVPLSVI